jgi:U3 small nucleolar RNA-associated protein 14
LLPPTRLSKIKSKEFHRRANKAAKRAARRTLAEGGGPTGSGDDGAGDADARRAAREEVEFERARERLTLKHKNSSRWARRALKRGVDVMDAGTKAALAEQMALGAALRRRVEGRGSGSGSDGSGGSTSASDGEGGGGGGMSAKGRREAAAILSGLSAPLEEGAGAEGGAKTGLFALPFMRRALEKQRAEAAAEAAAVIRDLDGGGAEEDGGGGGDDGGEAFGTARRLRFGGRGAGGAAARLGGGGGGSDEDEGGASDEDEDAEAKAERLGRRLRGEPEATAVPAAVVAAARKGGSSGGGAMPAAGLRRGAAAAATEGPVDVDIGNLAVGAGAAVTDGAAKQKRGGGGGGGGGSAVLAAASARKAAPGAQDWLFDGRQQQQQQEQGQEGSAAGQKQPAFVAASTFGGARQGYAFKRGPRGVGYYREAAPQQQRRQQQQKQQQRGGKGAAANGVAANGVAAHVAAAQQQAGGDSSGEEEPAAPAAQQQNGKPQQRQRQRAADGADADAAGHMVPLGGDADAQRALLRRAFAADDVAAEFAAEKAAEVEEQLPKEEVPGLMPGWGLWADQQREPKWMAEARAKAARRKEAAAAARKDARLAHVVVSEKWDKKASKYAAPALPFPYRSADAYESSIRQPLGREVNPDAAFRNLTRPAVIKAAGVVIDPLRYSKGAAEYGRTPGAKARGVITVAGGAPLQGEGPGGGAGPGAAGAAKKAKAGGGKKGGKR